MRGYEKNGFQALPCPLTEQETMGKTETQEMPFKCKSFSCEVVSTQAHVAHRSCVALHSCRYLKPAGHGTK